MMHKKFSIQILLIALLGGCVLLLSLILLLYNYDPLQLRKTSEYDGKKFEFLPEMRLQARGIIDNIEFDSVILGNSMLINTSSLETSKIFGEHFVNLCWNGANYYERSVVLNYLLSKRSVKSIIYSFEATSYLPSEQKLHQDGWELLYDDNRLNDLKTLLRPGFIKYSFQKLFFNDELSKPDIVTNHFFDKYISWMHLSINRERFGGLKNWAVSTRRFPLDNIFLHDVYNPPENFYKEYYRIDRPTVQLSKNNIDKYVLKFVEENPDTTFYIILPPFYRYHFAFMMQGFVRYNFHEEIVRYFVDKSQVHENLKIYGFETQDFLNDINLYMDIKHYHDKVNMFIIQSIAKGKFLLTVDNIDAYFETSAKLALDFDIPTFNDAFKKYAREGEQGKP